MVYAILKISKGFQCTLLTTASTNYWLMLAYTCSCHRLNGVTCWWTPLSFRAVSGLLIRKWPGVNTSSASDGSRMRASSLEFKHDSNCASPVINSSKLSLISPNAFLTCFLKLLTAAFHKPPKCGACSRVNFHVILCNAQNWGTESEVSLCIISFISLSAPGKFARWSLRYSFRNPPSSNKSSKRSYKCRGSKLKNQLQMNSFGDETDEDCSIRLCKDGPVDRSCMTSRSQALHNRLLHSQIHDPASNYPSGVGQIFEK